VPTTSHLVKTCGVPSAFELSSAENPVQIIVTNISNKDYLLTNKTKTFFPAFFRVAKNLFIMIRRNIKSAFARQKKVSIRKNPCQTVKKLIR
jgi:hypothetical protein